MKATIHCLVALGLFGAVAPLALAQHHGGGHRQTYHHYNPHVTSTHHAPSHVTSTHYAPSHVVTSTHHAPRHVHSVYSNTYTGHGGGHSGGGHVRHQSVHALAHTLFGH